MGRNREENPWEVYIWSEEFQQGVVWFRDKYKKFNRKMRSKIKTVKNKDTEV